MRKVELVALFGAALVLFGCGGSGGGSASGGSSDIEQTVGDVTTRTAGAVGPPLIVNSQNLVVTGMAGSSFSLARVNFPNQTQQNSADVLRQTQIVFSRTGTPWLYDFGEGESYALNPRGATFGNSSSPVVSPLGDRVYSSEYDEVTSQFQIFVTNTDGTGRTKLTTSASWKVTPDVSPDGSKIVFTTQIAGIYQACVMSASGGAFTQITSSPTTVANPRWSPDGTKIVYMQYGSGTGPSIVLCNANGSSPQTIVPGSSSYSFMYPDFAPGGDIFFVAAAGSNYYVYRWNGVAYYSYYSTTNPIGALSAAPDNRTLLLTMWNGTNYGLYTLPVEGGTPNLIYSADSLASGNWGPYIKAKSLIGNGGTLSTGAGFLMAQKAKYLTSYLVFDATTRSGTTLESQPANEYHTNIIVTIKASDNLTALRYGNKLFGPVTTVVTSSSPVSGAVVTFDSTSGDIAAVLPYVGTTPKIVSKPEGTTIEGQFTGAWTAKGDNMAPSGASTAKVQARTGKLIQTF